jgi:hypothetical protein
MNSSRRQFLGISARTAGKGCRHGPCQLARAGIDVKEGKRMGLAGLEG